MPKMKTHKAGAKRYRLTATGKLVRHQAGRNHINQKMSSKRKRSLDGAALVHKTDAIKIAIQLPYARHARH